MPSKRLLLKMVSIPSRKNRMFCVLLGESLTPGFCLLISCVGVVFYDDVRVFVNIFNVSVSSAMPGTG